MSWPAAKADGIKFAALILLQVGAARPSKIRLAVYPDADAYRFIKGTAPGEWPHAYHRMVVRAAARELKKAGHKIEFMPIELNAYFDWLAKAGETDGPATRAKYISHRTTE